MIIIAKGLSSKTAAPHNNAITVITEIHVHVFFRPFWYILKIMSQPY